MKDFPQPQIDQTRAYLESQKFPLEQITVNGKLFSYYVIPQTLNPALPDFALRMTHSDETHNVNGIFGVSDSVPQVLRPYWVMHEIIEFTQIGIEKKGRCANTERIVLEEIPTGLKKEFTERRISFFTQLCKFFEKDIDEKKGNYTIDDLTEAEASLLFLQTVQKLL